jgi:hypothetical protein
MALNPRQMLGLGNARPSMRYQQLNQSFQSDPRRILGQALMQQGASAAPVRTPLQGLGRLSSALVGAYLQRKAGDAQVERETAMTDQIMGMLGPNVAPNVRAAVAANPAAAQSALLAAQFAPTTSSELATLGDFTGVRTTQTNPITGATSSSIGNLVQPRAAAKPLDSFRPLTAAEIESYDLTADEAQNFQINETTGRLVSPRGAAPTVNVTNAPTLAGETEFAKGIAKAQVKQLETLTEKANLSAENEDAINSILSLYNRVESEGLDLSALTGPGADLKLNLTETLASIGGLFGFDLDELGIDAEKITDQQTLRAAFNKLSLEMTKVLKGAISEKELAVAQRATANFGNTPEANRMILLTQRAAAAKARAVENEAFRYIEANGNLGKGSLDGEEYNSFTQYQRKFVNRDKEFVIKQVIPEINSLSEMKALVKIAGGLNNLSDETVQLMDERLGTF